MKKVISIVNEYNRKQKRCECGSSKGNGYNGYKEAERSIPTLPKALQQAQILAKLRVAEC